VYDERKLVKMEQKLDPETNSTVTSREDGVLTILYPNGSQLIQFPDSTQILTKK